MVQSGWSDPRITSLSGGWKEWLIGQSAPFNGLSGSLGDKGDNGLAATVDDPITAIRVRLRAGFRIMMA